MRRTIASLGIVAVLTAGCAGDRSEGSSDGGADRRTPIVVDTDMGQDDMMALLYLLQRPDLRIEALTVSGTGLAHGDAGVDIAMSILDLAGAPDDLPVARGPEVPLLGAYPFPGAFPTSWRLATDDAYGIELPPSDRTPSTIPAPELLAATVREASDPVELLTLGPLTNVALALRSDPRLVDDLAGITVMGGALDVGGNVIRNGVAEWNVWVDPIAAREVIASGADVTLVPLDATNQAPVTPFFAEMLGRHHVTPEARAVAALFETQPYLLSGEYYFWDPLSAALVVEPDIATFEPRRVTVLEGSKEIQGQIVDDPDGTPVLVASGADALAFEREFLNTLNGDHAISSTRPKPVATITIDATGCTYGGPAALAAGLAAVEVVNATSTTWGTLLVSIAEGHTYADLTRLVDGFAPLDEPPPWVAPVAGAQTEPGETSLVPWRLGPGPYGLVCQTDDPWMLQAVSEIVAG
jgi:pyrimidine-specific ribonucleoside hydrolase